MPSRSRDWNAGSYDRVATPHAGWGDEVLSRIELRGDETVLDLGCGTGSVTRQLLDRLPHGQVIAVDGAPSMVQRARAAIGDRATVLHSDLLELTLDAPVDGAVSTATFHWIGDHDALFARVHAALKPGAPFVAQCGGKGNIASIAAGIDRAAADEPYAEFFAGWPGPWNYADAERTTQRLEAAGFDVEGCWLNDSPVTPDEPREFLATLGLGSHLERLPTALREPFVDAVMDQLGPPPIVWDYVRLNFVARRR